MTPQRSTHTLLASCWLTAPAKEWVFWRWDSATRFPEAGRLVATCSCPTTRHAAVRGKKLRPRQNASQQERSTTPSLSIGKGKWKQPSPQTATAARCNDPPGGEGGVVEQNPWFVRACRGCCQARAPPSSPAWGATLPVNPGPSRNPGSKQVNLPLFTISNSPSTRPHYARNLPPSFQPPTHFKLHTEHPLGQAG